MRNDERARDAYRFVKDIPKNADMNKKFRSLARTFPTMVQNNGLNVAVAFLLSKSTDEDAHRGLYDQLEKWLGKSNLMNELVELDRDSYRLTSQEVMAYAQWVKRFAEGRWNNDGEEK